MPGFAAYRDGLDERVIDEARGRLHSAGIATNLVIVRQLHPFPQHVLQPYIARAKQVIVVEHNATGQLASLIRLHAGSAVDGKLKSLLKYDGTTLYPAEVTAFCLNATSSC